jgi:broad-specificity NMP kinase
MLWLLSSLFGLLRCSLTSLDEYAPSSSIEEAAFERTPIRIEYSLHRVDLLKQISVLITSKFDVAIPISPQEFDEALFAINNNHGSETVISRFERIITSALLENLGSFDPGANVLMYLIRRSQKQGWFKSKLEEAVFTEYAREEDAFERLRQRLLTLSKLLESYNVRTIHSSFAEVCQKITEIVKEYSKDRYGECQWRYILYRKETERIKKELEQAKLEK